jgi:hypothetical protein
VLGVLQVALAVQLILRGLELVGVVKLSAITAGIVWML